MHNGKEGLKKLTTDGGSALSPLYPGFSCNNKEDLAMKTCSINIKSKQKNKRSRNTEIRMLTALFHAL